MGGIILLAQGGGTATFFGTAFLLGGLVAPVCKIVNASTSDNKINEQDMKEVMLKAAPQNNAPAYQPPGIPMSAAALQSHPNYEPSQMNHSLDHGPGLGAMLALGGGMILLFVCCFGVFIFMKKKPRRHSL